mmetsp:Transcript_7406/g.8215  ORF Transcript_7406/g.8215 Transcript_7406/m.8215 type:complete len:442 (+) Transcript_7406:159-1484(+)
MMMLIDSRQKRRREATLTITLLVKNNIFIIYCVIITVLQIQVLVDGFSHYHHRSCRRSQSRIRLTITNRNDRNTMTRTRIRIATLQQQQRQRQDYSSESSKKDSSSSLTSEEVSGVVSVAITSTTGTATTVPMSVPLPVSVGLTAAAVTSSTLNPIEFWCTTHMDVLYDKSLSMKCPFFRRRTTDLLDGIDMIMRFVVIRHKSLPLIGPPPSCRSIAAKHKNLNVHDLLEIIRVDWKSTATATATANKGETTKTKKIINQPQQNNKNNHKGYYITGRLNTAIYRDDCLFDGPDPDMPVRGLRKYLNAASQLFDTKTSTAELLSLEIINDNDIGNRSNDNNKDNDEDIPVIFKRTAIARTKKLTTRKSTKTTTTTIVARWKLQGVLQLPWHPSLPVWTGKTVYHLDDEHMIYCHEEFWDISVLQAFTQTLWPYVGNCIYGKE